jgi:nucleoside-diphosphate-sugar epimerase
MSVLVTGAAGFIGSVVARRLLEDGHTVVGFDNLNNAYDPRMKDHRLQELREWSVTRTGAPEGGACAGFHFQAVDIAELVALEEAWAKCGPFEAVINLAARAGVRQSVENPWVYVDTNITGTLNLLELCRRDGPAKFVLASTSSLYGSHNPLPYAEDADTNRPLSPYAASKKGAETLCHTYHFLHGLDVTVFRYFTVYGPAGRPDMSVFRFVQWVSEGRPVQVFGDGGQSRDFTYVDDIARGTIAGLRPLGYEVINLGGDQPAELKRLIQLVEAATGREARLEYGPAHPADVAATWASIEKAGELLGWRPEVSLEEGVARTVEWYRSNQEWAREIRTD